MPIGCCCGMNAWLGNGGKGCSGVKSGCLVFFSFFVFLSFFSFFLLPFEEMDSPSPIISVLTSENSLVKAPCRDLPTELSFCFDFFTFVSIDSFPRSKLSTELPCSPKLASRSGQFLAIKSWISSSLIPPSPLLKNSSSTSFSSMLLNPMNRTLALPFLRLMLSITACNKHFNTPNKYADQQSLEPHK